MDLIFLAVKCRLISRDQEEELIERLTEKQKSETAFEPEDFLLESGILSETDIRFLMRITHHLKMKMLDKRFGELGVANQLVRPENVRQALDQQNLIFRETRQSKPIGDILVEKRQISHAHRTAILLTQDRISDEFLAEAMNEIASTEIERISLNMRFGAIAVKKNIITLDQLNEALLLQKKEKADTGNRRYLGEILQQLQYLTSDDMSQILRIQKELEKRRLSLESALARYRSETHTHRRLYRSFTCHFSKKKLHAYVRKVRNTDGELFGAPEFISWLNALGIVFGILPEDQIQTFLDSATTGSQICVARGTLPQIGKSESVTFFCDTAPVTDETPADTLPLVRKGDVLARIIPAEDGHPGRDVSGFPIPPPPLVYTTLHCGQGVVRQGDFILADTDGLATLFKNRSLFVQPRTRITPVRNYQGTIDTDVSDIYQDTTLKLDGTISATGRVWCHRLEVSQDIRGQVYTTGDIHVKGIIGRPGSEQEHPARIRAEGDIFANKKIIHAYLITSKGLIAPNADLISSRVIALEHVVVKNILSDGSEPCIIQIGRQATSMETPFDKPIQTLRSELDQLMQKDTLDDLTRRFQEKLSAGGIYQSQHRVLTWLKTLTDSPVPDPAGDLEARLLCVLENPDLYPDLSPVPQRDLTAVQGFLESLMQDTRHLPQAELSTHLNDLCHLKYGMCRATLTAVPRHTSEYEREKQSIQDRIRQEEPRIQETRHRLQALISRRDGFLLRQEIQVYGSIPVLKVKNLVQQGTWIKGQESSLRVSQDIYGVKFSEFRKNPDEPARIIIEGLYD